MRTALFIALVAPLALIGCKKKTPEPAPVAAETAPAPLPITWSFGPATFDGDRTGGTGELSIQYSAKNGSDTGLLLTEIGFAVFKGEEKVCVGKSDVSEKAPSGGELSGKVTFACDYTMLPASGDLETKAHVVYTVGTEARDERVPATVAFKR